MKSKYVKLNKDKSNMEDVVLSFLPTIKRVIKKLEIEETEDLIHECLLSVLETLNKENYTTSTALGNITITIYKYVLKSRVLSGFDKIQNTCSLEKIRFILKCLNSKDEQAIMSYFDKYDHHPNRAYILMDEVSFEDYYDESDILLENEIVNKCYVEKLLEYLKPQERTIIEMLYGLNGREYTSLEIANMYHVTASWINMIKQRALKKLNHIIYSLDKMSR